ncbi:hypothetical protein K438DRAFT_1749411 [Mycena galopus ATCC 62051]|nr:hypothetical protein K438DRAFT_1749411 [Mycena galopus ATCC 62051]
MSRHTLAGWPGVIAVGALGCGIFISTLAISLSWVRRGLGGGLEAVRYLYKIQPWNPLQIGTCFLSASETDVGHRKRNAAECHRAAQLGNNQTTLAQSATKATDELCVAGGGEIFAHKNWTGGSKRLRMNTRDQQEGAGEERRLLVDGNKVTSFGLSEETK